MIDYELAKRLKDAGFPFKHPGSKWSKYIFPTLSELVEACGGNIWFGSINESYIAIKNGISVNKRTREEAVANLWLKLNANP